jgi:hypothetical protein
MQITTNIQLFLNTRSVIVMLPPFLGVSFVVLDVDIFPDLALWVRTSAFLKEYARADLTCI